MKQLDLIKATMTNAMFNKGITPDKLIKDNDCIFFYANGNDGTDFDWCCNDMLCEFMTYYKSSDMGACKMTVYRNGDANICIFDESGDGAYRCENPIDIKSFMSESSVKSLKSKLLRIEKKYRLFDKPFTVLEDVLRTEYA